MRLDVPEERQRGAGRQLHHLEVIEPQALAGVTDVDRHRLSVGALVGLRHHRPAAAWAIHGGKDNAGGRGFRWTVVNQRYTRGVPTWSKLGRSFNPDDTATFRRQESTLTLLNLGVLAALSAVHLGFVGMLGPPPRLLLVLFAARFVEQTALLAWWQTRTDALTPRALLAWAHTSVWVGVGFAALVLALATHEDSHYQILLILPLLSAAFRFSMPLVVSIALLAAALTIGQVWLAARARPQMVPGEYLRSRDDVAHLPCGEPGGHTAHRGPPDAGARVARPRRGARDGARTVDGRGEVRGRRPAGECGARTEIRNPVAMIASSLATAIRPHTSAEVRAELFGIAEREAQRLERVTSDFLAYARPRPIDGREMPLSAALSYTADLVRSRAAERGLRLVADDIPDVVARFDPTQVHQALLNLAANAIEATPAGGTVTLSAAEGADVIFRVLNSGPAIAPDVVDRLFEPFFTTRPAGTGLGLPIARSIARAHGGDLVLAINDATAVAFDVRVPAASTTRAHAQG